ncbi:uncharacterized protein LOC142540049 [Primulina tabacum]|uniref:uncharacterized protein LOC142540049 n=1 Tax=Primulina tabacum TaxID=48773 RepID=UPI003F597511
MMHSNYPPPIGLHISRLMPQSSNRGHVTELALQGTAIGADYSAIGKQETMSIPQFSNYGYYGELKPQAGYLRPEIGWSQQEHFQYHHPPPHHLDMRVINEREIEKERIREEMIRSDIAIRHVLEAEVSRVLMMEKESVLQRGSNGFPFSSLRTLLFESLMRLPCSVTRVEERWVLVDMIAKLLEERERLNGICETGRLDTLLPFQRGTSYLKVSEVKPAVHEDNKEEKIIFLPKPDVNASGSKREAETLDAFMKKKAKVEWSCAVCKVNTFSERQLNEHLGGRKHKNEESKMGTAQKGNENHRIGRATKCKSAAESLACEKLMKKRRRARKRSKKQQW